MEIKDSLLLIKKIKAKKRENLNYIAFIKFLAMIKIIKWHIFNWHKKPIDYGARMCEILFVSSGFLVGYNYNKIGMICDYESSFKYCYKHLRVFYPLLIIITIYGFFISTRKNNVFKELEIFISNIFMVIPWSRYWMQLTFHTAHTWFLSCLMISYFFTPLLLKGIKNIKCSLILFIIISFIRISIEEITVKASINMLDINFHVGPIIRLMEFYMGMLLIPFFYFLKNYFDNFQNSKFFKIIFTIIQLINYSIAMFLNINKKNAFFRIIKIVHDIGIQRQCKIISPIIIYYIMIKYNYILYRCYFVHIFCAFIFIIVAILFIFFVLLFLSHVMIMDIYQIYLLIKFCLQS